MRRIAIDSVAVAQTPLTFSNWAEVLSGMVRGRVGRGPATLSFSVRTGVKIDCPNAAGAWVPIYEIFGNDSYSLAWFLGPLAKRPIQVVDIGGHIGSFSCQLAQLNPGATIQAFEPSPVTAGFLRRNVEQNGFGDRVTVSVRALGAESDVSVLLDDNLGGSAVNYLLGADGQSAVGTATEVKTISFDEVVNKSPSPIEVVKIDCEGSEYDFIPASSPESWASVERVVMEYHPIPGKSWPDLRSWFENLGFTMIKHVSTIEGLGNAWLSRDPVPPQPRRRVLGRN
jgi:FkbM family methyltransferase